MTKPPHPFWLAHAEGVAARQAGTPHLANPYTGPRFDIHLKRGWSAGWFAGAYTQDDTTTTEKEKAA